MEAERDALIAESVSAAAIGNMRREIVREFARPDGEWPMETVDSWGADACGTPEAPLSINGIVGTPSLRRRPDGGMDMDVTVRRPEVGPSDERVRLFPDEVAVLRWDEHDASAAGQFAVINGDTTVAER